jgi:hypothetical protein
LVSGPPGLPRLGGRDEEAGGGAGVVGADGALDVAGVEGDVGVLGDSGFAGTDGGDVEGGEGWSRAWSWLRIEGGDEEEVDRVGVSEAHLAM